MSNHDPDQLRPATLRLYTRGWHHDEPAKTIADITACHDIFEVQLVRSDGTVLAVLPVAGLTIRSQHFTAGFHRLDLVNEDGSDAHVLGLLVEPIFALMDWVWVFNDGTLAPAPIDFIPRR